MHFIPRLQGPGYLLARKTQRCLESQMIHSALLLPRWHALLITVLAYPTFRLEIIMSIPEPIIIITEHQKMQ